MNIIWKDIPEFESAYEVSNTGLVRRKARQGATKYIEAKMVSVQVNYLGYEYVDLNYPKSTRTRKTVHQLVFAAFTPTFKYGQMINHIDGNKRNNTLANLEFSNAVHNNTHAHTLPNSTKPGKSKYKNVSICLDKRHKNPKPHYMASVHIANKRNYLGMFDLEVDAAKAVDAFLDKIGDTLRLRNFP